MAPATWYIDKEPASSSLDDLTRWAAESIDVAPEDEDEDCSNVGRAVAFGDEEDDSSDEEGSDDDDEEVGRAAGALFPLHAEGNDDSDSESEEHAEQLTGRRLGKGKGRARSKLAGPTVSSRVPGPAPAWARNAPLRPPAALTRQQPTTEQPEQELSPSPSTVPPPPLPLPAPVDLPFTASVLAPDIECGLFWDYENISLPRGMDGAHASNRLREVCLRFGRLVERRVYHDPDKVNSVQQGNRSALDMAGFTLVDCPARNLKETIDKKIIVDVMHFALTRVARHQPACVVLLTNDGDYAYMLSRLRDLQVHAVVIYTTGHAASALLTSCDRALTWQGDVLAAAEAAEATGAPIRTAAYAARAAHARSSSSSGKLKGRRLLSTGRAAALRLKPWGASRLRRATKRASAKPSSLSSSAPSPLRSSLSSSISKRIRRSDSSHYSSHTAADTGDDDAGQVEGWSFSLDELVDSGCGMDGDPHPQARAIEAALQAETLRVERRKALQKAPKERKRMRAMDDGDDEEEEGWGRVEEEEAISECGSLEQTGWRKALPAFGRGGKKAGKKGGRGYGTAPFVRGGPARKPYGVAKRPGKGKKFVKKGGSNSRKGSKKGRR